MPLGVLPLALVAPIDLPGFGSHQLSHLLVPDVFLGVLTVSELSHHGTAEGLGFEVLAHGVVLFGGLQVVVLEFILALGYFFGRFAQRAVERATFHSIFLTGI